MCRKFVVSVFDANDVAQRAQTDQTDFGLVDTKIEQSVVQFPVRSQRPVLVAHKFYFLRRLSRRAFRSTHSEIGITLRAMEFQTDIFVLATVRRRFHIKWV